MKTMEASSPVPSTMEMTMEMAKTRTPSARARSTRNVPAVNFSRALAEARSDQFIRRVQFAAEVVRQEEH